MVSGFRGSRVLSVRVWVSGFGVKRSVVEEFSVEALSVYLLRGFRFCEKGCNRGSAVCYRRVWILGCSVLPLWSRGGEL